MSEIYSQFYVNKSEQGFSDTLVAFGLARLLRDIMELQSLLDRDIRIQDRGSYYEIMCIPGVLGSQLNIFREHPITILQAIPTTYYEDKLPQGIPIINWDTINEYLQAKKDKVEAAYLPPKPVIDLDVLFAINPDSIQGYNGLVFKWWNARLHQPSIIAILLELFSHLPNDIENAIAEWKKIDNKYQMNIAAQITGQQIYNPTQGEGQNQPKADKLETKKKPKINFWMIEWLRTVGFFEVSIPRLMGKRSDEKDRKILILEPIDFTYADCTSVLNRFKETWFPDSSITFDVISVIRFLRILLEYFREPEQQILLPSLGRISHTVVSGFHSAYFKKMGKGRSLMNRSFLAFPGWIELHSEDDIERYDKLLEELQKIVGEMDESHSEAFTLLRILRDFLSGDRIEDFLEFAISYVGYYMKLREANPFINPISTQLVERIVVSMGKNFAAIADRNKYPGFHNIAAAIASSTVWAQHDKLTRNNTTYQIRYGLHRELARHSLVPERFLAALGEFIRNYNNETIRAMELEKSPRRTVVNPEDINDILKMMDDFDDCQMVAELLLAYGSGFMKFEKRESAKQEN